MVTTGKTTEGIIHDIYILASQFESTVLKFSALSFAAAYAVKENVLLSGMVLSCHDYLRSSPNEMSNMPKRTKKY
ncbi:unnamed protein product [Malus baccata var. baccata]